MKQILSFNITVSSVMWEIFLHLIFLVMRDYKMYPKSNTSYFKCVYLLPFLWSALDTFNAGPPSVLTEITSERCKEYTFSDQLQRNPRPQTPPPPFALPADTIKILVNTPQCALWTTRYGSIKSFRDRRDSSVISSKLHQQPKIKNVTWPKLS